MFTYRLTFNPRSKATNIGYYFFWGAVFSCNCRNKIRINVGGFEDSLFLTFYISSLLPLQILPTDFLSCQQAELRKINKAYLWPRSKGWIRAVKRIFNLQRLKSQICFIYFPEFVCLAASQVIFLDVDIYIFHRLSSMISC